MKKILKNQGFMLVEILVAVSIAVVLILAVMGVAQKSITISRESTHIAQAAFLLEEGAEAVRITRDDAWSNISGLAVGTNYYPTFSGGTWTLSAVDPGGLGIFSRKVVVASVKRSNVAGSTYEDIMTDGTGIDDPGTKLVTVTVTWSEQGATVTKTLSFYILDIFS